MTEASCEGTATLDEAIPDDGWEWAAVEVFGHIRHVGRMREEERIGVKMLRIDVPNEGDPAAKGWTTIYCGGTSIFSIRLCDRATALRANKPYELPTRLALTRPEVGGSCAPVRDDLPF